MKLGLITSALEQWAPPAYQESYDNSGLLVGRHDRDIRSALVALDCTEAVVDEAIERGADLIIAHHPIVFGGLKRFNETDYVQRTVMKAIRHDVALYALHTNLDNVHNGVNHHLANLLGLSGLKVLQPKSGTLEKVVVFVPHGHAEAVRTAMFMAGGGVISDYSECSFNVQGDGTFLAGADTNPAVGVRGERHTEPETRIEMVVHGHLFDAVVKAMTLAHPYEEVAYDRIHLNNVVQNIGSGMLGELSEPVPWHTFFDHVKSVLSATVIRHTQLPDRPVKTVAVCGGSGVFLLGAARRMGADILLTSDVKYHQFFDAEGLVLADVGHWESEHRTMELIERFLNEKFPNFAVHFSLINTNPVKYY